MARNRGDDSFVAHTKSAVAPVKSSAICDYVAPRFRENATPESIISTICAPHSGRNCRRSVKAFADPTAYKLKVKRPGSDESRKVNVDLLETFNWLIGFTGRCG